MLFKSELNNISDVYTAEKTTQVRPQDTFKFDSRYLDGDSNLMIEAFKAA